MASNKAFILDEISEKKCLLGGENECSDFDSDEENADADHEMWVVEFEEIAMDILTRLKEQCRKRGLTICDKLKVTHVENFLEASMR